jgi:hypothetical protein
MHAWASLDIVTLTPKSLGNGGGLVDIGCADTRRS